MTKPGRNELCHCGSGRKYKKCHGPKEGDSTARSRFLMIVVGGGIIAAVAIGIAQFTTGGATQAGGRTWDPTHGHYHDANGFEIP
jgi:hypothetical protein